MLCIGGLLLFRKFGSNAKSDNGRNIFGTGAAIAFMCTPVNEVCQSGAAADIKDTNAFGRVNLVARKREQIHTKCLNIHLQFTNGLYGIGVARDAMCLCDFTDLRERLDRAVFVIDVHDGDKDCRIADCVAEVFNANPSVSIDRQISYLETALLQIVTGMQNGMMLYSGGDDMVAFTSALLQLGQSFDSVIICFGAASCEDDFTRTFGADEFSNLFARGVNCSACFASVGVDAGTVTECLGEIGHHRVPNFGTERCCGVVV